MSDLNFSNTASTDYANNVEDYSVGAMNVDSAGAQEETFWQNTNWAVQWAYFNKHPDLKSALVMKTIWNVGKGYVCDPETQITLEYLKGKGKETFDDILFNMDLIKRIGGDSYGEIIRDKDSGELINIKCLDPGAMKVIYDEFGMIKRYEYVKVIKGRETFVKFETKDILHFINNPCADQIHGISDIDVLVETLKAEEENFADMKKIMHHQAIPFLIFKVKSDDTVKIGKFRNSLNELRKTGDDFIIPDDENVISFERVEINISQAIFEWRNDIRNKFYRTIGLPQIIPGAGGQGTESESKVIYLAFEQIVEREQRYIEKQLWNQLYVKIELVPPASLSQELQQDTAKDSGQMGMNASEMMPGVGE